MFGCLADELCRETGVDLYFHPFLADAVVSEDGGSRNGDRRGNQERLKADLR